LRIANCELRIANCELRKVLYRAGRYMQTWRSISVPLLLW